MTLGKQFDNTYWYEEGKDQPSVSLRDPERPRRPIVKEDLGTGGLAALDSFREERGITAPLQGMLFSPYVGTGLKKDPTVSPESRREAMDKAAGFNTPIKRYISSVKSYFGKTIGERAAEGHQELVRDAFDRTDFPVAEMRKTNAHVLVDPQAGRSWAEERGPTIRLNWDPGHIERTRVVEQVPTVGKPIPNLKFWEYYRKNLHEPELADKDILNEATHWVNPTTGHTYGSLKDEYSDTSEHPDFEGMHYTDIVENLRKRGYVPNLFPGKTPATTKHVGKTVKIEYDWSNSNSYDTRWNTRTMHTRHEPGEGTETRVRFESTRTRPEADENTLIHEIGHQRDALMSDNYSHRRLTGNSAKGTTMKADPVEEGIADAHADRYSRNAGLFDDSVLSDHAEVTKRFGNSGYRIGYSGWRNKLDEAIYIASRLHSQTSPTAHKEIPSRGLLMDELMTRKEKYHGFSADSKALSRALKRNEKKKWYNKESTHTVRSNQEEKAAYDLADSLFLGHMVENFPHVREHLESTGYGKVVDKAHKEYMSRKYPVFTSAEQLKLPGMDKF